MIRVVLAVVLATALLGVSLPAAETAERDRNAAVATDELAHLADAAESLLAHNDPSEDGAQIVVELRVPDPTLTEGGRLLIEHDRLVWWPRRGPNRTVAIDAPVSAPTIVVADTARVRLSLVRIDGRPTVRIERARVQGGSGDQKTRASEPIRRGDGVSVRTDVRSRSALRRRRGMPGKRTARVRR